MIARQERPNMLMMRLTKENSLIIRQKDRDKIYISGLNRENMVTKGCVESKCPHDNNYCRIHPHPIDVNCVLETCVICGFIRNYNLTQKDTSIFFNRKDFKCSDFCYGPNDSLILINKDGLVLKHEFNKRMNSLQLVRSVETGTKDVWDIRYDRKHDMLIIVRLERDVQAVRLSDGSAIWNFSGEASGHRIEPVSVCSDNSGRVFIGNTRGGLVWVLEAETGVLLQEICIKDWEIVGDLCWSDTPPQLNVFHGQIGKGGIAICAEREQDK